MLTAGAAVVICVQWILVTRCPFWPPLAVLVVAAFAWVSRLLISRGIHSLSTRQRTGEGLGAWCLFEAVTISWVSLVALGWQARYFMFVVMGSLQLLMFWVQWSSQPKRQVRWVNAHPWQRRAEGVVFLGLLLAPIVLVLPRLLLLFGISDLTWPLVAVLTAPTAWLAWGPVLAWYSFVEYPVLPPDLQAEEEARLLAATQGGTTFTAPASTSQ